MQRREKEANEYRREHKPRNLHRGSAASGVARYNTWFLVTVGPSSRRRRTKRSMVSGYASLQLNESDSPAGTWYRADVDGLRGLAILSVICYHCALPGFDFGYLGVDVFFVISGYVVSVAFERQRCHDCSLRQVFWDYKMFLARRCRRLAPAFFLCMLVTALLVSTLVWDTKHQKDYLRTTLAAVFGCSNIFMALREHQYGDELVQRNPLTHTWSLGVEEQYYLVMLCTDLLTWPIAKLAAISSHDTLRDFMVALLAIVSAALFLIFSTSKTEFLWRHAFFLCPLRFWQLASGSILASRCSPGGAKSNVAMHTRLSYLLQLAALALAVLTCSGWLDIATEIGEISVTQHAFATGLALCCILAGHFEKSCILSRLLSCRLLVQIGLLSYSLYLYHQPIIALLPLYTNVGKPACVLIVFVAAIVSRRCVEEPALRYRLQCTSDAFRLFGFSFAAAASVTCLTVFLLRTPDEIGVQMDRVRRDPVELQYGPVERNRGAVELKHSPVERNRGSVELKRDRICECKMPPGIEVDAKLSISRWVNSSSTTPCLDAREWKYSAAAHGNAVADRYSSLSSRTSKKAAIVLIGDSWAGQLIVPLRIIARDRNATLAILKVPRTGHCAIRQDLESFGMEKRLREANIMRGDNVILALSTPRLVRGDVCRPPHTSVQQMLQRTVEQIHEVARAAGASFLIVDGIVPVLASPGRFTTCRRTSLHEPPVEQCTWNKKKLTKLSEEVRELYGKIPRGVRHWSYADIFCKKDICDSQLSSNSGQGGYWTEDGDHLTVLGASYIYAPLCQTLSQ